MSPLYKKERMQNWETAELITELQVPLNTGTNNHNESTQEMSNSQHGSIKNKQSVVDLLSFYHEKGWR